MSGWPGCVLGGNALSQNKLIEAVDWYVREIDPAAVRLPDRPTTTAMSRWRRPGEGMADLWGRLRATDAAGVRPAFDGWVGGQRVS